MEAQRNAVTHLEHLEDLVFLKGIVGVDEILLLLDDFIDTLDDPQSLHSVQVNRKWDGSPSIVFGADPRKEEHWRFFVGTKSAFNTRKPRLAHNADEIDALYRKPEVNEALKSIIDGLRRVYTGTNIFQGELLFTLDRKKEQTILGKRYLTFTPNLITYALPVDESSGFYRRIRDSSFGVVVNQLYTSSPSPRGSAIVVSAVAFDFDTAEVMIGKSREAGFFLDHAYLKGLKADDLEPDISNADTIIGSVEIGADWLDPWFDDIWMGDKSVIKTVGRRFVNWLVRDSSSLIRGWSTKERFLNDLRSFTERNVGLTSDRVQKAIFDILENDEKEFGKYVDIFLNLVKVKYCVLKALRKLPTENAWETFVRTSKGFKTISNEGFVISTSSSAVKLVDRMEFSRLNLLFGGFKK